MNREDDMHRDRERDERAALQALRESPRSAAPDTARARARASFLSAASSPRRSASARRLSWLMVPIAACVAAVLIYASIPRDQWMIVDLVMPQEIQVAGQIPQLGERVVGGPVTTTPCSEVEFTLEDRLRLRFLSEASGSLPSAPGRWLRKKRTLYLERGEVFGSTGGGIDFTLRLETPEASATLQGTTFAVFRTDDATCFCLFEGRILFTPAGSDEASLLPVEQRVFIYRDGRPPHFEDLTARERMKLEMMHNAAAPE